jgi:hypothetical protein
MLGLLRRNEPPVRVSLKRKRLIVLCGASGFAELRCGLDRGHPPRPQGASFACRLTSKAINIHI